MVLYAEQYLLINHCVHDLIGHIEGFDMYLYSHSVGVKRTMHVYHDVENDLLRLENNGHMNDEKN